MPTIKFTPHLAQHLDCPSGTVDASTLRGALDLVFDTNPRLRGYVLDDQGAIRTHVAVFVDGQLVHDRINWGVPLSPSSQIYVMQALSGG